MRRDDHLDTRSTGIGDWAALTSYSARRAGMGARGKRFGRRAPGVDSDAAAAAALDNRHLHARARQPSRQSRAWLPGPDDVRIVDMLGSREAGPTGLARPVGS